MRRRWTRGVLALLAAVAAIIATACGDDGDGRALLSSEALLRPGAAGVGVTTIAFEDPSRPTMPNRGIPGSPSRRLVTEIWYPSDPHPAAPKEGSRDVPLARGRGPHPLVMYSHGFMDSRTGGAFLARHLTTHGYIVASPDYPLTNMGTPGGANAADVAEQPGDVQFLIDQLLALNADSQSRFFGTIDARRIGLTGLSLGGLTTYLAAFHPTFRDPRIRAAAPLAGPGCFFGAGFFAGPRLPLLIVHGDIDAIVPYREHALFAFAQARSPKYLVTIRGASHTGFTNVAAELFAGLNNPDEVGCEALSRRPTSDDPGFLERLGGPAAGIIMGDCPRSCPDPPPLPRAIAPARQHELTILSVLAFFDAYLRDDRRARRFLQETLGTQNAEIAVAAEP